MTNQIFEDRDMVAEALGLPAEVQFSVIGLPTEAYEEELISAVHGVVGDDAVSERDSRLSRTGRYKSYRIKAHCESIEVVEEFYRVIRRIEGTRVIL